MTHFKDLDLPTPLLEHLHQLGFHQMTPIQRQTIPLILAGKDLIAQAKTGSGKTLAFLLPLLLQLRPNQSQPQALIITPTRELAQQIAQTLQALARYRTNLKIITLYGGTSLTQQVNSLQKGADLLIGTPGRLLDHLHRNTLPLENIKTLVLDEGDRMLEMGFERDILKIIASLPKTHQTLLFSATYPPNIQTLSQKILHHPQQIVANKSPHATTPSTIQEIGYHHLSNKEQNLIEVLQHHQPKRVIIFCTTKVTTKAIHRLLDRKGFDTVALHGDLEQYERQEVLIQFSNGSFPIMVATDLAARGLDVEEIDLVINYDLPNKPQEYVHRIGRTGRANAQGVAITLIDPPALIIKLPEIRPKLELLSIDTLTPQDDFRLRGEMGTLCIEGGKKKKIRAGDIVGTLCQEVGIEKHDIGKITLLERHAYVAIRRSVIKEAYHGLKRAKIKKRKVRLWWL